MRKNGIFSTFATFVALAANTGCTAPENAEPELGRTRSGLVTAPEARWLTVLQPGQNSCPTVQGGWALEPPRGGPLSRFCEYQFASSAAHPAPNPNELARPEVEKLDDAEHGLVLGRADPVVGQVPNFMEIMSATLYPLFAYHLDIPRAPALIPTSRSRLALVDSMPEDAPAPRSTHAPMLTAIARAASCVEDDCAIDIAHHLALPRIEGGRLDYLNGGHYGTLWELAQAIVEAVDAAHAANAPSLVINLSVGWDGTSRPDLPADHLSIVRGTDQTLSASERAVHTALVYARCSGALILAATGNDEAGRRDRSGPLLPAGWATHRAPSPAECSNMFEVDAEGDGREDHPLVYPIGGVDHRDLLLENARVASTPELVAPSSAVMVPGSQSIMTGTSVGTLIASAAAGIVWSIRPELDAEQVFEIVRSSAVPVGSTASFCPDGNCQRSRRVSLCRAEAAACSERGDCAQLECGPVDRPPPGIRPITMFLDAAALVIQEEQGLTVLNHEQPVTLPGCGAVRLISGVAPPVECPFNSPLAARHLDSGPQPVDPMCPACAVVDRPQALWLMVKLVAEIPGDRIYTPYLWVKNSQEQVMRYELPATLPEGHQEVFQMLPTGWSSQVTSAWLVYDLMYGGNRYASGGTLLVE